LFQWNISGWCHSLGKIDIVIVVRVSQLHRERVTDFPAAWWMKLVRLMQPGPRPTIPARPWATHSGRVGLKVERLAD
jgi:hypothetical protein